MDELLGVGGGPLAEALDRLSDLHLRRVPELHLLLQGTLLVPAVLTILHGLGLAFVCIGLHRIPFEKLRAWVGSQK